MSYVTLVHPAKAVGWHEVSFGRNSNAYVVPGSIVLDRDPSPPPPPTGEIRECGTLLPPIAKLVWPLLPLFWFT